MAQREIFGPFFGLMLPTLAVWVYMYVRRIRFIRSERIKPGELALPGVHRRRSPTGPTTS